MSMVFNYYAFGTSNIDDILYNLKDKLSENGWTIDYDKISTEGKLAFHVTDTQCYYTIYKAPNYQNLNEAYNHFHPYLVDANTDIDSGNWYSPTLSYEGNPTVYASYFVITNSYCLANSKFCTLILEGYTYHNPDYPHCLYYFFGQLEIPNESQQGNFLWITPMYSYITTYNRFGNEPALEIGVYYKDTLCKPATIEEPDKLFYGLCYEYKTGVEKDYPKNEDYNYSYYGYIDNNENSWNNPPSGYKYLPFLGIQPYQFGRLYLRTLIVYHKYEQDGVTYIHPIAETPFYLCKYRGIEWYNKTITYNTRKFKVYPLAGKGINYASEFGIAFEVGNL